MALIGAAAGAGLLGGALLGKKRAQSQLQQQPMAPAPTDATAITPPAPPIVNPADQQLAANAAGLKQRKRAARGSLLTNPTAPASSAGAVVPRYATRSLLGS